MNDDDMWLLTLSDTVGVGTIQIVSGNQDTLARLSEWVIAVYADEENAIRAKTMLEAWVGRIAIASATVQRPTLSPPYKVTC